MRDSAKSSESPLRALTPKASALNGDSRDLAESRTRDDDDEVVQPRSGSDSKSTFRGRFEVQI